MSTPLYRYGALAWLWRILGAAALAAALGLSVLALEASSLWPLAVALPLCLPVIVLFPMVATQIAWSGAEGRELRVHTLAGFVRRVERTQLAGYRFRTAATMDSGSVHAPRVWVLVRGGLPLYFDLLATIPDKRAFAAALGLPPRVFGR